MKTKLKLFILILFITTILMWILGVLRFYSDIFKIIHNIIFFPFGFLAVFLEDYLLANHLNSRLLNDEILSGIIWLMSVLLQAILYYFIIIKLRKKKNISFNLDESLITQTEKGKNTEIKNQNNL